MQPDTQTVHVGRQRQAVFQGISGLGCCLGIVCFNFLLVPLLILFWPSVFPVRPFQFWGLHGPLPGIVTTAIPLFLVGGLTNFILLLASRRRLWHFLEMPNDIWMPSDLLSRIPYYTVTTSGPGYSNSRAHLYSNKYARGCWHVLLKGVMGELGFRWFFFYAGMIGVSVANYLLLGFAGYNLLQMLFTSIVFPAADFVTLHMLHTYLFQLPWTVGASMILTALPWWPRKHYLKYAVPTFLLTWWPGMFFFLLMLQYGLFTAILVRLVYEIMIQWLVQVLIIRMPRPVEEVVEESV